jgi:hypothetical protein
MTTPTTRRPRKPKADPNAPSLAASVRRELEGRPQAVLDHVLTALMLLLADAFDRCTYARDKVSLAREFRATRKEWTEATKHVGRPPDVLDQIHARRAARALAKAAKADD